MGTELAMLSILKSASDRKQNGGWNVKIGKWKKRLTTAKD